MKQRIWPLKEQKCVFHDKTKTKNKTKIICINEIYIYIYIYMYYLLCNYLLFENKYTHFTHTNLHSSI